MVVETSLKDRMISWAKDLQNTMVESLESYEPAEKFEQKIWERPGGGGGDTRILTNGKVFEKAGVNTSIVHGDLPESLKKRLQVKESKFFATGISSVIHPLSPQVPTIHFNFRYFEQPDRAWFGGGIDLTPYVYSEDDFRHFHQVLKTVCDQYETEAYARFKKECDDYFYIAHREERRGIGGIFFDYLSEDVDKIFGFVQNCGNHIMEAYRPIVDRNTMKSFSARQKKFQLLRRGRYVEFNLVYDRGTLFGLQTKGNIESILMSLPAVVHFDYNPDLEQNESEKKLMEVFKNPRDWV